jgi:hypothetical protein
MALKQVQGDVLGDGQGDHERKGRYFAAIPWAFRTGA